MARINLQNMIEEGTAQMSQSRNLTEKEELIEQLSTLDIEEPKREECSQEVIMTLKNQSIYFVFANDFAIQHSTIYYSLLFYMCRQF